MREKDRQLRRRRQRRNKRRKRRRCDGDDSTSLDSKFVDRRETSSRRKRSEPNDEDPGPEKSES